MLYSDPAKTENQSLGVDPQKNIQDFIDDKSVGGVLKQAIHLCLEQMRRISIDPSTVRAVAAAGEDGAEDGAEDEDGESATATAPPASATGDADSGDADSDDRQLLGFAGRLRAGATLKGFT